MVINNFQLNLLGPYIFAQDVLKERVEVYKYFNFFYGKTMADQKTEFMNEFNEGQSWQVSAGLDFKPTQEVRNHVKRIIKRQARFMFGVAPTIMLKGYDKKDNEKAEELRQFLDKNIFEKNEFWNDTLKAFLDATIGKRVLLRVEANPNEPIKLRYHSMDEFTYEVDPKDYKRFVKVTIAYMNKEGELRPDAQQVWRRWQYVLKEDGYCYLTYGTYDGYCKPIEETEVNTMFTEIPCKVILNDAMLGDLQGSSDVRDLIDMQNDYNRTNSDYRDALKFKMFEQPVFIDADEDSVDDIKIAPNAMIELHTDPTIEGGKADAKMLSSSFSFVQGAKEFIDGLKNDMYDTMDQPKPEDIKTVPSGIALRMTFYDLMSRCDEKWGAWESALKWLVKFSVKSIIQLGLFKGEWKAEWNTLDFKIVITHNYPIPEDEKENKTTGIQEVQANVRSIESYIKEFSDEEDYESEYNTILKEIKDVNNATQDDMEVTTRDEIDANNNLIKDNENNNLDNKSTELDNKTKVTDRNNTELDKDTSKIQDNK